MVLPPTLGPRAPRAVADVLYPADDARPPAEDVTAKVRLPINGYPAGLPGPIGRPPAKASFQWQADCVALPTWEEQVPDASVPPGMDAVLPDVSLPMGREKALAELDKAVDSNVCIRNGFVHLLNANSDPSILNPASCPPDVLKMQHPRTTVMLRNVPSRATEAKIRDFATNLGCFPLACRVPLDKFSGCSKGYAFLRFATQDIAEDFMQRSDQQQLAGSTTAKRLEAQFAKKEIELEPDFWLQGFPQPPS